MTVVELLSIAGVSWYCALSIMGLMAAREARRFTTKALGRRLSDVPAWVYIVLVWPVALLTMWAVGVVAMSNKARCTTIFMKSVLRNHDLTPEERQRLRTALAKHEEHSL